MIRVVAHRSNFAVTFSTGEGKAGKPAKVFDRRFRLIYDVRGGFAAIFKPNAVWLGTNLVAAKYRDFQIQQHDDVTIVYLADPPENQSAHRIQDELLRFVEKSRPQKLVVSFQNVSRCTTDMVNALLRGRKRLTDLDGDLKLSDMQPHIREVFTMLRLERTVLNIYPTLAVAIQEFSGER